MRLKYGGSEEGVALNTKSRALQKWKGNVSRKEERKTRRKLHVVRHNAPFDALLALILPVACQDRRGKLSSREASLR